MPDPLLFIVRPPACTISEVFGLDVLAPAAQIPAIWAICRFTGDVPWSFAAKGRNW